jgi:hypothetical protein
VASALALIGALELLSAADSNILISLLNLGLGDSRVSTRTAYGEVNSNCFVLEPPLASGAS